MNIQKNPSFYLGCVEDRMDPLMLGRVRVRILGLHTHDKAVLPTEDLPWAYKIQPTTSGAITGIGHAPVGVMEGTWVILQFIDPDKQMPFVIGSIGGIPQSKIPPLESFELLNTESNVQASEPEQTGPPEQDPPKTTTEKLEAVAGSIPVRRPSEFKFSAEGVSLLKQFEGFKARPYQDSAGIWTIGYGTTRINGQPVTANTAPVTEAYAAELLQAHVEEIAAPAVRSGLRVPITQSMFDACVSLTYNIGAGAFRSSSVARFANTGEYASAAEAFMMWNKAGGVVVNGLTSRRTREKNHFLRDGIPQKDGSIQETPASIKADEDAIMNAPGGVAQSTPAGASAALYERKTFNGQLGFKDPNDKYPLKTHLDEPDTNRLARHQKIRDTVVYFKETAEHKGVATANGADVGSWDQSPTPYNAKYPYNNVWQSEGGHIMEYDDTPGAERMHWYHTKGTFMEIDHNGTFVRRVIGDDYQILERNGFVHVIGNVNVCVEGAKTLLVNNTLDVEVMGTTVINIHDSATMNVADDFTLTVGGNFKVNTGGYFSHNIGGKADIKAGANINLEAGAAFNAKAGAIAAMSGGSSVFLQAGGLIAGDAGSILWNGGASQPAGSASPQSPAFTDGVGGEKVALGELKVNTRGEEAAATYETPEDGTPAEIQAYKEQRIKDGTATVEDLTTKPDVQAEQVPPENNVEPVMGECGVVIGATTFDYNAKISKYFTLGQLTAGGSRKLSAQNGLRADQIYCNLKALATNILDPIYQKYADMQINSGYRQGTDNSQHNKGQAVDISFPSLSRSDLYYRILEIQKMVPYDQLILEYASGPGWIHISFDPSGGRKQQFTMNNHTRVSKDVYTIAKIY